jgi:glycosyltransferase involved in cell wall biosynthesis
MRSYYVIRHLAQHHQITLLTFVRDSDQPAYIAHLAEFCQAVHTVPMRRSQLRDLRFSLQSILTGQPFLILRDHVPAMLEKLRQLTGLIPFDAIHADQLWMAQYALAAKKFAPAAKLVLDQHNAVYLIPQRMAGDEAHPLKRLFLKGESKRLATYERDICREFDAVVWVTAEDRQAVARLADGWQSQLLAAPVIPICGDPALTEPVPRAAKPFRVTFLGGLHWPPNAQGVVWFAREVFPQVKVKYPQAVLTVIGKNPPAGIEGPGVEVTGYVTDPKPFLAETSAFIVPLHAGGGMRVKIIDAWSWGLPIVSTTIGAEGIEIRPGQDILIADTPGDFAEAVGQLLHSPEFGQKLAHNGRQTVLEKYSWRTIYPAWDTIYQDRHIA